MSATVIRNLVQFANTANDDAEIEAYIGAHSHDVCEALGVSLDQLWRETSKGGPLLKGLKRIIAAKHKRDAVDARACLDHDAARVVRESWPVGDKIVLDTALLAAAVKAPGLTYLAFSLPSGDSIWVRADKVRAIAKLFSKRPINAWLDSKGLHYRWASGGLTLIAQADDDRGSTIVRVVFPAPQSVAA